MAPRGLPPRLVRAYRETSYRAIGIGVRVGRRSSDVLLDQLHARTAVLLTAWNPQSHRMPDGWNNRMQQRLRQCLRRFAVVEAVGSLGTWREVMLLAAGDPRRLIRLARRFRQRAVVVLQRGQKARLRAV